MTCFCFGKRKPPRRPSVLSPSQEALEHGNRAFELQPIRSALQPVPPAAQNNSMKAKEKVSFDIDDLVEIAHPYRASHFRHSWNDQANQGIFDIDEVESKPKRKSNPPIQSTWTDEEQVNVPALTRPRRRISQPERYLWKGKNTFLDVDQIESMYPVRSRSQILKDREHLLSESSILRPGSKGKAPIRHDEWGKEGRRKRESREGGILGDHEEFAHGSAAIRREKRASGQADAAKIRHRTRGYCLHCQLQMDQAASAALPALYR